MRKEEQGAAWLIGSRAGCRLTGVEGTLWDQELGWTRVVGAGKRVCLHAPANPGAGAWNGQDLVCQALQLSDLCRRLTAQGPLPATPQPWGPVLPADQESGAGTGLSRELVYRTMPQGGAQVRHSLAITFWVLGGPVIRFQNPA